MNKNDLAKFYVKNKYASSINNANDQIDKFISSVKEMLKSGEKLTIKGFISMQIVEKPAKKYKNPMTGEKQVLSPKKRVKIGQTPSFKKWAEGD